MEHHDISLLLRSHTPILTLETHEEARAIELMKEIALNMSFPIFKWSVAVGMQRVDLDMDPQALLKDPAKALGHIHSSELEAIYMLLDFHPFMEDPVIVRHLKELAMSVRDTRTRLVLVSHKLQMPPEVKKLSVNVTLSLPDEAALLEIVRKEAAAYTRERENRRVSTDKKVLQQLVNNLKGLTYNDARSLARSAIVDDGAITESDLPQVMQAKYRLLSGNDLLSFEFKTSSFSELAGMNALKQWLAHREKFFHQSVDAPGMEIPRGILLLGVQGCGKSVAAKAVAGVWKVPLLRLDFGNLYNKYIGESESNIREALKTAEVMSPCVLWIDEIEKGISTSEHDDGTSQRILGTLLTWMAENNKPVFIVATSNDIQRLPPELIRKGRLDEVFFVDLPTREIRERILQIHLDKRGLDTDALDLCQLSDLSEGFSGSEIEQLVVSAVYTAHARDSAVDMALLIDEIKKTRPLSVLMVEKIAALRQWAESRTVSVE
ncbi:MAG: AAA family ATPase [Gammaproteobacteria bacterium]|nr:AAA family ATPase [Gammaproteobacteria bacterium]